MFNFLDTIKSDPVYYRQLQCGEQLVTEYNCPLDKPQMDLWSHENYLVYVLEGQKGWRSIDGPVFLGPGQAAFIRKGASIVDQYLEKPFCLILFFFTDEFICETLRPMKLEKQGSPVRIPSILTLHTTPVLHGFFQGMLAYFQHAAATPQSLLELKFKELLLMVIDVQHNAELLSYFCSLLNDPLQQRIRRVMEDNYSFNLELQDYARLCGRSLSAFKRDFQEIYKMPPGRWLRERRLQRAHVLLASGDLQVSEVAFQCGFENLSHFSRTFKEAFGISPAAAQREAMA